MKIAPFFIAVVTLLFASCEQEIEVEIPETPPKIMINSTLVPYELPNGKYLGVELRGSRHIFDSTSNTLITNAIVLLYTDSIFMDTLKYEEDAQFYSLGFPPLDGPKAGESYQISVSAPAIPTCMPKPLFPKKLKLTR